MMNKLLLLFLFAHLYTFGNGSPVDGSMVKGGGQIKMITKQYVSLDKEFLFVSLQGDYANVVVRYTLTNHGKDEQITYAFPINYNNDAWATYDEGVRHFKMRFNNSLIKDIQVRSDTMNRETNPSDYRITKWYIGTIYLKKEKAGQLEITYKVKLSFQDAVVKEGPFPHYGLRRFFYDFSPASNWGNGKVKDFQLVINSSDVIASGDTVVSFQVPNDQKFDELYSIHLTDCDFKKLNPIEIEVNVENSKKTAIYNKLSAKLYQVKNADCSSRNNPKELRNTAHENPSSSLRNLFDNDFNTAWYETRQGSSIGEILTFELDSSVNIEWVGLVNGFTKNRETYYNNERIKTLKIDFWKTYSGSANAKSYSQIIELPDRKYEDWDKINYGNFVDLLLGEIALRKFEITILEVYPGLKYKDLCVSELYIGIGKTFDNNYSGY